MLVLAALLLAPAAAHRRARAPAAAASTCPVAAGADPAAYLAPPLDVACLQACVALHPASLECLETLADVYETHLADPAAAAAYWERAIEVAPDRAALAHLRLGLRHNGLRAWDRAAEHFEAAAALRPDSAVPLNNLGNVRFWGLDDAAGAIAAFEGALALEPSAMAHCNLGLAHARLGDAGAAARHYEACAELNDSTSVDLLASLGYGFLELGELDRSRRYFAEALGRQGTRADAWNGVGQASLRMGDVDAARHAFERALAIDPRYAEAWHGQALSIGPGRPAEYRAALERAVGLDPSNSGFLQSLGAALLVAGDLDGSRAVLERAVAADPENALSQSLRVYIAQLTWEWPLPALAGDAPMAPFQSLMVRGVDGAQQRAIAEAAFARATKDVQALPPRSEPRAGGPVRVLFLSTGLQVGHPVGAQFQSVYALLAARSDIAVSCMTGSAATVAPFERCEAVGALADIEVAHRIREADIDILVDLHGWLEGHRMGVVAHRPARVHVAGLGYPGTTGGQDAVDRVLVDATVAPAAVRGAWLSEAAVIEMPRCYQVSEHRAQYGGIKAPAARTGPVVFAALHQNVKIEPGVVALWADILRQAPEARLWLLAGPNEALLLEAVGEEVADRIVFVPRLDKAGHLERLAAADVDLIGLDTVVCNGHTTGLDMLWTGVPFVTLVGDTMAARVGASLLTAHLDPATAGRLVAASPREYVEQAVALATDGAWRAQARAAVAAARGGAGSVFDEAQWADEFAGLLLSLDLGE